MTDKILFTEYGGESYLIQYECTEKIFSGRSRLQSIDIVDTVEYGRMLFLDGVAQYCERDEFIYHETLVHPALLTHPDPKNVCVIGGADGGAVREIFRHPGVEWVDLVDIDRELVSLCHQYLSEWNTSTVDRSRLQIHYDDGRRFLETSTRQYDVIIVDLSDPIPDSPAVYLFTREFYRTIGKRLADDGVCSLQGETLTPWRIELHARMVNTLKSVFPHVSSFPYNMPSFHEPHAQILASKTYDPRAGDWGARMADIDLTLEYLKPDMVPGMFQMPGYVDRAYDEFKSILTDERPCLLSFGAGGRPG